jgi:Ca2+-binding RTX toxin-like protein
MATYLPGGRVAPEPFVTLTGTADNDEITGTEGADFFFMDDGGWDFVWGGGGDDSFYFGGTYAFPDSVDGGSGNDTLILQGLITAELTNLTLKGVEMVVLMPAADTRFGASGTGSAGYSLSPTDTLLAAGQQLTIQGNKLGANEAIAFLGFTETDGNFRLIGGASSDSLFGGAGADMICGGLGADFMGGMDGDDVYVYRSAAESTVAAPDRISSLGVGDRFDLRLIDADTGQAGDQAFAFIGSDAFHNVAGELRAFGDSGGWTIQADTNGDGIADFAITGQLGDPPLDAGFFLL